MIQSLIIQLWHYASQLESRVAKFLFDNKKSKNIKAMGIEEMLDRVIVIDNCNDEIDDLVLKLRNIDIAVDAPDYTDDYAQFPVYTHNHQLIFMDLMLDEDISKLKTNISRIIQILNHIVGEGFGPYGLVLWTKHPDHLSEVLQRLGKASEANNGVEEQQGEDDEVIMEEISLSNPPIFVISINKVQFKSDGRWDFTNVISIINEQIRQSNASYFFLRWLSATRLASQSSISDIYNLTSRYENKEREIEYLLYLLAMNYTGISQKYPGLSADTYKAFSDILHPKINALTGSESLPSFNEIDELYDLKNKEAILAHLNSILFIDSIGILQTEIVPGNVYQVMDLTSPLIVKTEEKVMLQKKNPQNKMQYYKDYACTPIAIELTPPCDFSHKKISSRLIGGYMMNYCCHQNKKLKISSCDKFYVLPPIYIPGHSEIQYVIFDYRHLYTPSEEQLKDSKCFKVLFRANHSLFSDILQKFSSHAARLGLNGLLP